MVLLDSLAETPAGLQYNDFARNLTSEELIHAVSLVSHSEKFELNGTCHIRLVGSNTLVGFIGNESLEFCYQDGIDRDLYKPIYKHLKKIFKASCKNRNQGSAL